MLRRTILKILGLGGAAVTIPVLVKEEKSEIFNSPQTFAINPETGTEDTPLSGPEETPTEREQITALWIVRETLDLIHKNLPGYPALQIISEEDQETLQTTGRALGTSVGPAAIDSRLHAARMIGTDVNWSYKDMELSREKFSKRYLSPVAEVLAEQITFENPTMCAECIVPRGIDMAARVTDKDTGLSLRYVRAYDISADRFINRFDMILV